MKTKMANKAQKQKMIDQTKEYIIEVMEEVTSFVPIIRYYQCVWSEDKTNTDGGDFSVIYEPTNFTVEFHVYKELFEKIPANGLTDGFRNFIKSGIAHEVGHCYIWELEGTKRDIEKTASLIGSLIHEILDYKRL